MRDDYTCIEVDMNCLVYNDDKVHGIFLERNETPNYQRIYNYFSHAHVAGPQNQNIWLAQSPCRQARESSD